MKLLKPVWSTRPVEPEWLDIPGFWILNSFHFQFSWNAMSWFPVMIVSDRGGGVREVPLLPAPRSSPWFSASQLDGGMS